MMQCVCNVTMDKQKTFTCHIETNTEVVAVAAADAGVVHFGISYAEHYREILKSLPSPHVDIEYAVGKM